MNQINDKPHPSYGPTNPAPGNQAAGQRQRYGSLIELNLEKEQAYRDLHAAVWPTIVERIKQANIENYSIYVAPIGDRKYLFSYFEYTGSNFAADMASIAEDPETKRWWRETIPCQTPLPNRKPDEWWMDLESVFHLD